MLDRMSRLSRLLALALLIGACSPGDPQAADPTAASPPGTTMSPGPTSTPSPRAADLSRVRLKLTKVATLDSPVAMATRTGDPALYVAEKTGRVRAIMNGQVEPHPVLDVSGEVSLGSEQGLLGLAFSPDGDFLYVNYTDASGDTRVIEYGMGDEAARADTAREVLFVDQPYANHNGGNLTFGPDGFLYIGLGDGGSGGDPHDNGQSLGTLLGKMLRIDPRPSGGKAFGVPDDNPFRGRDGADPAIWAYGLRNPWRYSFDRETGDLWIGDVGQNSREEIDVQPAGSTGGENYGWNRLEGTVAFAGDPPGNAVDPVFDYPTGIGCAVTGGYVYRGAAIEHLFGGYLFGDFCAGFVRGIVVKDRKVVQEKEFGIQVASLSSFGEDQEGELYALSLGGSVFRIEPG
jgi:glucose/arabinose dehydrogenase